MENERYHRAFGVYGICWSDDKLLVINKGGGPYKNRFDLPGGSLEHGESLAECVQREVLEETGFVIKVEESVGVADFILPWDWKGFTHVHHIAVFYTVSIGGGALLQPEHFPGQDSLGALWVSKSDLSIENASPLVMRAVHWLDTKELGVGVERYEEWEVL
ncbi:NUDIX hydrolase [Lederbergia wuyishanensis]|uniref:ADP-ribose pyrophosphatase YjhB (NUDIX family) n=1 Tax=Lederbergia wuyishanensis TaxID=1347903 RepID=A0ABU0D256_9BACI|nr:NUDIX hydrolase [Lederbergia wuyishanensis]MCJ8007348.1 NUDIX hydrolase [Lederbergia wuyishanensis]MDQ0342486.1 ADP-ribose pyrophosphatase YjhB (NUDIX family) [Lederbergia wuyishanensis]